MENLPAATETFDSLMQLEKIQPQHLKQLQPEVKAGFLNEVYRRLKHLTGVERDAFIEKTKAVLDQDAIWDYNHARITEAISQHVTEHGCMPSKSMLALQCGLSRKTISNHLQTHEKSAGWENQRDLINIMRQRVAASVMKAALEGDAKAVRAFFEAVRALNACRVVYNELPNQTEINNTVINQQIIQQHLSPQQLEQIEQLIAIQSGGDKKD
jgi:hypothetical protein